MGARLKIAGALAAADLMGMAPYDEITEGAIAAMVARFYGKARQDAMIGPLFNAAVADWAEHLVKLGISGRRSC